jgi:hypothetical protein
MPNSLLTVSQITRKALAILHQKCNFIGSMNRGYDDQYAKQGAKIGDTLRIRLPNEYAVRTGLAMSSQSTNERKVDLVVNNVKGVDMDWSSIDLTLSLDDWAERVGEPAMSTLATNVESDTFQGLYKQVWNLVDQDGSAFGLNTLSASRQLLTDNLAPTSPRNAILKTAHTTKFINDTKSLFQASDNIEMQYREGKLGMTAGFRGVWENTVFADHQTGTAAKTTGYLANSAAVQSGSSIIVDTGTTTFLKGDVITFANVFAVHRETKQNTGVLQQFVITADSGASATTLQISPAIVLTGGNQNVNAGVADNAAVVKVGAGANELLNSSLGFHRDAFTFATADLVLPDGQDKSARAVMDGIAMSMVRGFNISDRTFPARWDVLYGYALLRGELANRMHADTP